MSAVESRSRLAEGDDIRLVDARTPAEFETGHTSTASYHLPLDALREHRDEFLHVAAHVVLVCQSGSRAALAAGAIVLTSVLTSLALPAASAGAGVVDVGLVVAAAPARGRSAIDGDNSSDDGHADNETTL